MLYWVVRPWRQAFDFRGRAARREYWLFLVQLYLAFVLMMVAAGFLLGLAAPELLDDDENPLIPLLVGGAMLLMLVPYLAASVRRLHDHDKSGWLFLLSFIPLVGWIFFLIMMLTPGTQGENGYGPDPRDRGESPETMYEVFR